MKRFLYKAQDKNGTAVSGEVEGTDQSAAVKTLQEKGLLVISITQKRELSLKIFKINVEGVSGGDIAIFTRLLATMLTAGLPLVDALSNLVTQFKNKYFKEIIGTILHDVQSGGSLSESMKKYPKVFSNLYVSLVKAGEASGKMDDALLKLADMLEEEQEFRGKIKGAMIYPAIVTVAMIAVGIFMVTAIIPKIADVYKQFGSELPLPTRILVGISDLTTGYFYVGLAVIIFMFFTYRFFRKNPMTDYAMNNMVFGLPIIGNLQQEVNISIMTRTLGTLVGAGVGILDSLKIVARAMGNNYFQSGLVDAAQLVEKGLPLSLALGRNPDFPPILHQLTAIGEETGTLDESLLRVAKFYQESAERTVKGLTSALEPIMIMIMGLMVGGMAIAVLLPMFNLVNVIH